MQIDIHTHLFPNDIRNRRENWFDGEPAFRLLYEPPRSRMCGAEELIRTMDEQGIDRSVIFGFPWNNLETSRKNNDYIIESVQRYPDRLIGLGCLNPCHPAADTEVARCLDCGLKGIGELAFYERGIDETVLEALDPIMSLCHTRQVPVMVHTNEPIGHLYPGKAPMTLMQIYRMVRRYPENDLILAHWGGGLFFYALMKKEVRQSLARVWFDTAASPFLYDPAIYREAVAILGPDRILFGSDFPLLPPQRYRKEMEQSGIDGFVISQIMGGNAKRLLGM
jgi:predicted TIM-barrel fold metal-dependent hydrolase